MLTINLLFIRIGISVHEKTMEEELHYRKVKENMDNAATNAVGKQPWLF